jgi:hypothetical protein
MRLAMLAAGLAPAALVLAHVAAKARPGAGGGVLPVSFIVGACAALAVIPCNLDSTHCCGLIVWGRSRVPL